MTRIEQAVVRLERALARLDTALLVPRQEAPEDGAQAALVGVIAARVDAALARIGTVIGDEG